jgi:uncharacterized membrane protein
MGLFVRGLYVLLALAFVVLLYYVTIWVLGLIGIQVPENILKIVFVILGLLAVIGALQGRFDSIVAKT